MNRIQQLPVLLLLCILVFTSCKSKQGITKRSGKISKDIYEVVEKTQENQPHFATANVGKMNISFNMDRRQMNVSASCRIRKDSAIHVSIQPIFGVEMFKMEMTPEEIIIYDKMNRKSYSAYYQQINQLLGININFYDIQALICNQYFRVGESVADASGCKLNENNVRFENQKMIQQTTINSDYRIEKVLLELKGREHYMQAEYSDFASEALYSFPQKVSFSVWNSKKSLDCLFSISKVVFDGNVKIYPINPSGYERADISRLFQK